MRASMRSCMALPLSSASCPPMSSHHTSRAHPLRPTSSPSSAPTTSCCCFAENRASSFTSVLPPVFWTQLRASRRTRGEREEGGEEGEKEWRVKKEGEEE
eukprot:2545101-Rhodomonas_salina.1